jgi:hypothetical protein
MNALTSITWFLLMLIPFALLAMVLIFRGNLWRDRNLVWRGGIALCVAMLAFLPFLIPYYLVSKEYGLKRTTAEVQVFCAHFSDWIDVDTHNKFWKALGAKRGPTANGENALFPGFLPPLFSLVAILFLIGKLVGRNRGDDGREAQPPGYSRLIQIIDFIVVSGVLTVLLLPEREFTRMKMALFLLALIRLCMRYPRFMRVKGQSNLLDTLRSKQFSDAEAVGILFAVLGFAGSFGLNLFFHRFLFEHVPGFNAMRVPERWAMICDLGLALLAGVGVYNIVHSLGKRGMKAIAGVSFLLICCGFLTEQRVVPLEFVKGAVDGNSFTDFMRTVPMRGGLAELPTGIQETDFLYTLRSADHVRPLITATNSFIPPIQQEIFGLANQVPIQDRLMDLLESIPASYVAVHRDLVDELNASAIDDFLRRQVAQNRLRYVRSFNQDTSVDLYAVVKTEPAPVSEGPLPASLLTDIRPSGNWIDQPLNFIKQQYADILGREPDPEGLRFWTRELTGCRRDHDCAARQRTEISFTFMTSRELDATSGFVLRLYKAALGVRPTFAQYNSDIKELQAKRHAGQGEEAFIDDWLRRKTLTDNLPGNLPDTSSPKELVDQLFKNSGVETGVSGYDQLVSDAQNGRNRVQIIRAAVESDALKNGDSEGNFVLLNYFTLLRRDPDPEGYDYWMRKIKKGSESDSREMTAAFINSKEYRDRFNQ